MPMKVRLTFKKTDEAVFISHLDISRLFVRALNRAGIKVKYTQGFNPHAYIVFGVPLSLGYESICERVDFEVVSNETPQEIIERLNRAMPGGIEITECLEPQKKFKEIGFARWEITAEKDGPISDEEIERMRELFSSDEIIITRETKRTKGEVNLIEKSRGIEVGREGENAVKITAALSSRPEDVLNPEYVVRAACEKLGMEFYDVFYRRIEFFDENMEIFR
ncbi:MAG: TIGR03936 family radical SAM-associated protein [Clostridia bacterium]|nr:TIGR03936 family radical SAM-associated protein [Clostridia bacterium]